MIERASYEIVREKGITDVEATAVVDFLKARQDALDSLIKPLVNPHQGSLV